MSDSSETDKRAIRRWMYSDRLGCFFQRDEALILGALLQHSTGNVELTQRLAWRTQVRLLQSLILPVFILQGARIYFELAVPRLGRRADVVLLVGHVLFILEIITTEISNVGHGV